MDKCLDEIKLHLPEEMKRTIQDLAMEDDRKVSEWIRHQLQLIIQFRQAGIVLMKLPEKASGE